MKERNYGLDLLRLVSMLMVVVLHTLGHGGLLNATTPYSKTYYVIWLMESFALCAVNCYGILSGYIGIERKYSYSNLVTLWMQVLVYSVGITLLAAYLGKVELTLNILRVAFFPVVYGEYWYFTAYVGLFLMMPVINAGLKNMTQHQIDTLLAGCIIMYCVIPTCFSRDPFLFSGGYSFAWLMILYMIGACIQRTNMFSKVRYWWCGAVYVVSSFLAWFFKYYTEKQQIQIEKSNLLMLYTTPALLLAAISLFLMFEKIKLPKHSRKLVEIFSPAAFGVYLIHDNGKIREHFISGISTGLAGEGVKTAVFGVAGIVIKIYVICLCVDVIRCRIFSMLKIKERLQRLETKWIGSLWSE